MSTVGKYLAARFEQIGLKHYFMVPGDFNLVLLDELLSSKNLEQIGCCNELNAAYAAEGYARVNGRGAVITTFNVERFRRLAVSRLLTRNACRSFSSQRAPTPTILPRIISCTTRSQPMTSPINMRCSRR